MSEPRFDYDDLFDADYLYFYESVLTAEVSAAETDVVRRLLDLTAGDGVVDLGCGQGRIAARLAKAGCTVLGVDTTAGFLAVAEPGPVYLRADMRHVPLATAGVDAVVSWFTSFGYFDEAGNRQVLAEAARVLRPGGRVLIETANREVVVPRLPQEVRLDRGADSLVDQVRHDDATQRVETDRTITRDGRRRAAHFSVRLYSPDEWVDLLHAAGFTDVAFADETGRPLTTESARLIAYAVRTSSTRPCQLAR